MEENKRYENTAENRDEIYSRPVRAGKRTYFFDVKSTRNGDYYLTITESKKKFNEDGTQNFEKHKIFLYKEDFKKFTEGLADVVSFVKSSQDCEERDSSNYYNQENKLDNNNQTTEIDGDLNKGIASINFDSI